MKKITLKQTKKTKKLESKNEKSFRLCCKEIFLTYPQSGNLELGYVIHTLEQKLYTYNFNDYIASIELHQDGNPHIHVYLKTVKNFDTRNSRYFDIELDGKIYHPNIQAAKKVGRVIKYILKSASSKYDQNLLFSSSISSKIDENGNFMSLDQAAISMAKRGEINKVLKLYEEERPSFYIRNHISLEKSLRALTLREHGITAKFDFSKYNLPVGMKEDLDYAFANNKSVVLLGEPGTGKSHFIDSWCNFLGLNHLIINDFNSISNFKEGIHNAIVIDDTSFKSLEREVIIKLLDSESVCTFRVLYCSITIPAGTPRFVLSNRTLESLVPFKLDDAITRRIKVINIEGCKLFKL